MRLQGVLMFAMPPACQIKMKRAVEIRVKNHFEENFTKYSNPLDRSYGNFCSDQNDSWQSGPKHTRTPGVPGCHCGAGRGNGTE